jgi:hypothetical protein
MRFKVFTAVKIVIVVFWLVTPYSIWQVGTDTAVSISRVNGGTTLAASTRLQQTIP